MPFKPTLSTSTSPSLLSSKVFFSLFKLLGPTSGSSAYTHLRFLSGFSLLGCLHLAFTSWHSVHKVDLLGLSLHLSPYSTYWLHSSSSDTFTLPLPHCCTVTSSAYYHQLHHNKPKVTYMFFGLLLRPVPLYLHPLLLLCLMALCPLMYPLLCLLLTSSCLPPALVILSGTHTIIIILILHKLHIGPIFDVVNWSRHGNSRKLRSTHKSQWTLYSGAQ